VRLADRRRADTKQAAAYRLSASGRDALAHLPAGAKAKRALMLALSQSDCAEELLLASSPRARTILAELGNAGWIERYRPSPQPDGGRFIEKVALNAEQQQVLGEIERAGPAYGCFCCTASPAAARPRSTCA